ncbi:MAG: hypothetical protein ACRDRL_21300 [Sciscionella sp.]
MLELNDDRDLRGIRNVEDRHHRLVRAEEEDDLLLGTYIDPCRYSVASLRPCRRDTGQHSEKHGSS